MIFESLTALVASVSGIVALACFIAIPACCYTHTNSITNTTDEGWRDEPPRLVRFIRRIFDLLSHDSAVEISHRLLSENEKARIHASSSKAGYSYSILVGEFVLIKLFGLLAGSVVVA